MALVGVLWPQGGAQIACVARLTTLVYDVEAAVARANPLTTTALAVGSGGLSATTPSTLAAQLLDPTTLTFSAEAQGSAAMSAAHPNDAGASAALAGDVQAGAATPTGATASASSASDLLTTEAGSVSISISRCPND